MKLKELTAEFPILTQSKEGLDALRNMVLGLAVRGKLVEQDPKDEPASALLVRIQEEKQRLIEEGKLKKQKKLPPITEEEIPFEIPSSWEWCRIASVSKDFGQKRPDKRFRYIDVSTINNSSFLVEDPQVIEPQNAPSRARKMVSEKCVLYSTVRPYLKNVTVIETEDNLETIASTAFEVVAPLAQIDIHYCFYYMIGSDLAQIVEKAMTGVAYPAISKKDFALVPFPLPPLAEQKRIVAKIEELFAQIDVLEEQLETQSKLDEHLQIGLSQDIQNATTSEESKATWSIITNNFETLFQTPASIDNLKKHILSEAVRGRLVPQDPNDEPASELLVRIQEEKQRLIDEGKLKKQKKLPPIAEEEIPFEIPESWAWCRFGDISINRDGERVPLSKSVRENHKKIYDYYGASGVIDKVEDFLFDKTLLLIGEDGANLLYRSTPIAFIASGKYWVNNHAHVIDFSSNTLMLYMERFINAISLEPYVAGTAQPKMNQAKMNSILVSLPPLAEQKRIVAKIEELFAWCDQLKSQIQSRQSVNADLIQALSNELLETVG